MTGLVHLAAGKVRDVYAAGDDRLLVVASDRVSALDAVLPTPVPDKGRVLTALSLWWFDRIAELVPHHLVSADDPAIPPGWRGRAMLVRRLEMLPVECVARGYLAGSGVASYRDTGAVCGVPLPPGLVDGSVADLHPHHEGAGRVARRGDDVLGRRRTGGCPAGGVAA